MYSMNVYNCMNVHIADREQLYSLLMLTICLLGDLMVKTSLQVLEVASLSPGDHLNHFFPNRVTSNLGY